MSKFIIGDLVTLSAAGRRNEHNSQVLGRIGIIINTRHRASYPFQVQWLGAPIWGLSGQSGKNELPMKEYELKFAKKEALDNL